jgi:hypothetical protein
MICVAVSVAVIGIIRSNGMNVGMKHFDEFDPAQLPVARVIEMAGTP